MVGEIGIPRREYLYELTYCDMVLIQRGYAARYRNMWSATRWQTYLIMQSQVGTEGLRKAGINSASDLIQFPWELQKPSLPSDDEVADLLSEMADINRQAKT